MTTKALANICHLQKHQLILVTFKRNRAINICTHFHGKKRYPCRNRGSVTIANYTSAYEKVYSNSSKLTTLSSTGWCIVEWIMNRLTGFYAQQIIIQFVIITQP